MPDDKSKTNPLEPAAPAAPSSQPESLDSLEPKADLQAPAPVAPAKPPKKPGGLQAIRNKVNIFTLVFALIVLAAGVVVFVSLKPAKKANQTPLGKLSDQQLSALKSNSTLVGDPKQTLDIQSNSVFEGQVLARDGVSVAGDLKVGGNLSLPNITIPGTGNFAQVGVTGPLSVGGDTNLQGQLSVQKNLNVTGSANFGSLSVATLSVTSLQVKNDFTLSKHIVTSGSTPGRGVGTAVGSGGSASVSGTDTAGTVNINTGGSPPAGLFVTISFTQRFAATPRVVITPIGSTAASLQYYVNRDSNGFSIGTANAPPAGSSFAFDYITIQ